MVQASTIMTDAVLAELFGFLGLIGKAEILQ